MTIRENEILGVLDLLMTGGVGQYLRLPAGVHVFDVGFPTTQEELARACRDSILQLRRYCAGDPPEQLIPEEVRSHIRSACDSTDYEHQLLDALEGTERKLAQALAVTRDLHSHKVLAVVSLAREMMVRAFPGVPTHNLAKALRDLDGHAPCPGCLFCDGWTAPKSVESEDDE